MKNKINNKSYHYLFAVRFSTTDSENPGRLNLDFCVEYKTSDIKNIEEAQRLHQKKLPASNMTAGEATDAYGVSDLIQSFTIMKLRAKVNQMSIHLIHTEKKISKDLIQSMIRTNKNLLSTSKISL